jgi:hypothetical protein
MCGCSANFDGDNEYDNFTSNRPKVMVYDDANLDPDGFNNFTSNRPKVMVYDDANLDPDGFNNFTDKPMSYNLDDNGFSNFGGKGKARRQARRDRKNGVTTNPDGTTKSADAGDGSTDTEKNSYGTESWFSNNWIWLVGGLAVVGVGYMIYKKRKK